jgi:putative transposase
MDFAAPELSNGRCFQVLNMVDDYSQQIVRQCVSIPTTGRQFGRFLNLMIEQRGKPDKIICDNGTELTIKAMFFWRKESGVSLGFI